MIGTLEHNTGGDQKKPQVVIQIAESVLKLENGVKTAKAEIIAINSQGVTELEALMVEKKIIENLLVLAKETLKNINDLIPKLEDEEQQKLSFAKYFEEIKESIKRYEGRHFAIEEKINSIERLPGLHAVDDADEIARVIDIKLKKALEVFSPQIDTLAESMKKSAEKRYSIWQKKREKEDVAHNKEKKIKDLLFKARLMAKGTTKLSSDIFAIGNYENSAADDIEKSLLAEKKKLGLFGFGASIFSKGENDAIDTIFSGMALFQEYKEAKSAALDFGNKFEKAKAETSGLIEQFKAILSDSWGVQNEIKGLNGSNHNIVTLPSLLESRLRAAIEAFTGADGGKTWKEVTKDSMNAALYSIWCDVKSSSLASSQIDPKYLAE